MPTIVCHPSSLGLLVAGSDVLGKSAVVSEVLRSDDQRVAFRNYVLGEDDKTVATNKEVCQHGATGKTTGTT